MQGRQKQIERVCFYYNKKITDELSRSDQLPNSQTLKNYVKDLEQAFVNPLLDVSKDLEKNEQKIPEEVLKIPEPDDYSDKDDVYAVCVKMCGMGLFELNWFTYYKKQDYNIPGVDLLADTYVSIIRKIIYFLESFAAKFENQYDEDLYEYADQLSDKLNQYFSN